MMQTYLTGLEVVCMWRTQSQILQREKVWEPNAVDFYPFSQMFFHHPKEGPEGLWMFEERYKCCLRDCSLKAEIIIFLLAWVLIKHMVGGLFVTFVHFCCSPPCLISLCSVLWKKTFQGAAGENKRHYFYEP